MTARFPHHYHVDLMRWDEASVLVATPRPPIRAGAPALFGGSDDWWSPEHLLLAAIELCFSTTLQALARNTDVSIPSYRSRIEGVLDKTKDGLAFTSIRLEAFLSVDASQVQRAEAVLAAAAKRCIVSNTLAVPVEHTWHVTPSQPVAASI